MNGIVQYFLFWVVFWWILCLGDSFKLLLSNNGLFFLILESKNTTQFILAGEGHLNQTQFWTIMNKGSISIFVHVKLRTHYWVHSQVRLVRSYVFLTLLYSQINFQSGCVDCPPTSNIWQYSSHSMCSLSLCFDSYFLLLQLIYYCSFNLHFPDNVLSTFPYAFWL